ncbi:MAG: type 4 pilus major pilin [Methylobacter sp.]|jgi:Tfp pilus assembly protein PilV
MKMNTKNTPRTINKSRFGQAGASLLEALSFIIISLIIVLGAVGLWKMSSSGSKESAAASQILAAQIKYRGAYSGQSSYGTGVITDPNLLPSDLKVNGAVVTNGWNGPVVITGASGTFTISWAGVPDSSCSKLATINSEWLGVSVNGTAQTLPVTTALANAACKTGSNTVLFTSN